MIKILIQCIAGVQIHFPLSPKRTMVWVLHIEMSVFRKVALTKKAIKERSISEANLNSCHSGIIMNKYVKNGKSELTVLDNWRRFFSPSIFSIMEYKK